MYKPATSKAVFGPCINATRTAGIRAHIFDVDKNMSCIFEITTIDKQNEPAKFYRGEIHRLMILII